MKSYTKNTISLRKTQKSKHSLSTLSKKSIPDKQANVSLIKELPKSSPLSYLIGTNFDDPELYQKYLVVKKEEKIKSLIRRLIEDSYAKIVAKKGKYA